MDKYEKLKEALIKAIECAKNAKTEEDGGTCNSDSPVLLYSKMGYQKQKTISVIESVGLSCWMPYGIHWKGALILSGMTSGQGYCRTAMAEAFRESLKESEIESGMYYQVD